MDEYINCILAICCPPEAAEAALAKFLVEYGGMHANHAEQAAACMTKHFDLAEKGSLQAFKDSVARLARGADYQG